MVRGDSWKLPVSSCFSSRSPRDSASLGDACPPDAYEWGVGVVLSPCLRALHLYHGLSTPREELFSRRQGNASKDMYATLWRKGELHVLMGRAGQGGRTARLEKRQERLETKNGIGPGKQGASSVRSRGCTCRRLHGPSRAWARRRQR